MTPEELAAYREWVRISNFESNTWPQMGLSHIDQQAARIAELEAQVAALKEIAIGESAYILSVNVIESTGVDEFHRKTAKDLLSEEHPEAFR